MAALFASCLALAWPPAAGAEATPAVDSRELAATLRDMLMGHRIAATLDERLFVTPEEVEAALAPQSAWGRENVRAYREEWTSALDVLGQALRQYGDLERALAPSGLIIAVEKRQFEEKPEYRVIDRFIPNVHPPGCDGNGSDGSEDDKGTNCFIRLYLKQKADGSLGLDNIRIVDRHGRFVPIPGKKQR